MGGRSFLAPGHTLQVLASSLYAIVKYFVAAGFPLLSLPLGVARDYIVWVKLFGRILPTDTRLHPEPNAKMLTHFLLVLV